MAVRSPQRAHKLCGRVFCPSEEELSVVCLISQLFFVSLPQKDDDMDDNNFIRFDWAAKRMLRDKANFGVFEGLITVLLNEPVHIIEILESESNQIKGDSTYGCVVLRAANNKGD